MRKSCSHWRNRRCWPVCREPAQHQRPHGRAAGRAVRLPVCRRTATLRSSTTSANIRSSGFGVCGIRRFGADHPHGRAGGSLGGGGSGPHGGCPGASWEHPEAIVGRVPRRSRYCSGEKHPKQHRERVRGFRMTPSSACALSWRVCRNVLEEMGNRIRGGAGYLFSRWSTCH